jgi:SprT protein
MALIRRELHTLAHFLPNGALDPVLASLHQHGIHLKITRGRKSVLGDYRPAYKGQPHRISVNGDLNPYHFLVTFLHELAHLETHIRFGRRVNPHGPEWQESFAKLLRDYLALKLFPSDLEPVLQRSISRPAASTCSDPVLYRALSAFNPPGGMVRVEDLAPGSHFRTERGQHFTLIGKRRTRYLCHERGSGRGFLFPGIHEVYPEE